MKILLVNSLFPNLGIGGSEKSTYYLAKGLSELGHDVQVFSQNIHDQTITEVVDGINVIRAASRAGTGPNVFAEPYYQRLAISTGTRGHSLEKQFAEAAAKFDPDVVNTAVAGRLLQLWRETKATRSVCIHTLRSYTLLCSRRMVADGDPCLRQCRDCAATRTKAQGDSAIVDGVVGISRHILNVHLRSGWFKGSRANTVIGNSFEVPERAPPTGEQKFEFGYIGRLHPTKGVELFLDAAERLRQETGLPCRTLVAGTGDQSYENWLRNRYQNEFVEFLGYVTPAAFFERVKFCVVPSIWYEPFGRIFIESLHYGIPVIGSRRGGGAEILSDGMTGWLFEPELQPMIDTLRRAASLDDAGYARMTKMAGDTADRYSVRSVATQYASFYERVRDQVQ